MCINVIQTLNWNKNLNFPFYLMRWNSNIYFLEMKLDEISLSSLFAFHWNSILNTHVCILLLNRGKFVFTSRFTHQNKSIGYKTYMCRNRHCLCYMLLEKDNPKFVRSILLCSTLLLLNLCHFSECFPLIVSLYISYVCVCMLYV